MVHDFDEWYLAQRPAMTRALTAWCGNATIATDALDEAFVRSVERWERVRRMRSPSGWLWTTAANLARRRMRRSALEGLAWQRRSTRTTQAAPGPSGVDVDVRRALLTLTERQRTAVVLHYFADLTLREIGALMDVAEGTVAATLHQARGRLAEELESSDGLAASRPIRTIPTDGASS